MFGGPFNQPSRSPKSRLAVAQRIERALHLIARQMTSSMCNATQGCRLSPAGSLTFNAIAESANLEDIHRSRYNSNASNLGPKKAHKQKYGRDTPEENLIMKPAYAYVLSGSLPATTHQWQGGRHCPWLASASLQPHTFLHTVLAANSKSVVGRAGHWTHPPAFTSSGQLGPPKGLRPPSGATSSQRRRLLEYDGAPLAAGGKKQEPGQVAPAHRTNRTHKLKYCKAVLHAFMPSDSSARLSK